MNFFEFSTRCSARNHTKTCLVKLFQGILFFGKVKLFLCQILTLMISALFTHPSTNPHEDHCFFQILLTFCEAPHATFKFSLNFLGRLVAFNLLRVEATLLKFDY